MMKKTILVALLGGITMTAFSREPVICYKRVPEGLNGYRNKTDQTDPNNPNCDKTYLCEAPGQKNCAHKPSTGDDQIPGIIVTPWHETVLEQMDQYGITQMANNVPTGLYTETFYNPNDGLTYIFTVTWELDSEGNSTTYLSWSVQPVVGG